MKRLILLAVLSSIASPAYGQVALGTSTSATNPQRSGDATTGLFSSTTGAVSVSSAGNEMMRVNGTGVGIGTTSPQAQLDVYSSSSVLNRGIESYQFSSDVVAAYMNLFKARGSKGTPSAVSNNDYVGGINTFGFDGTNFVYSAGLGGRVNGTVSTGSVPQDLFFFTSGGASDGDPYANGHVRMVISSGGNVGIGTTAPDAILSLGGQSAQTIDMVRETTTSTAGNNLTVHAGGAVSGGTNLNGGNLILSSGITTGTGTSNIQFNTYPAGSTGTSDGTALTAAIISATGATGSNAVTTLQGNAGSGTNKNGGTLTLSSGVSTGTGTSSMNFNAYGAGTSGSAANSPTTVMTIIGTGNVGIGTTSPDSNTDLTLQSGGDAQLSLKNSSGTTKAYVGTAGTFGTGSTDDLRIRSESSDILFGFSGFEKMRLTSGGSLGISTTSPQATLDVGGFARLALNSSAPATCSASNEGAIALTHLAQVCICDTTPAWHILNTNTACSW